MYALFYKHTVYASGFIINHNKLCTLSFAEAIIKLSDRNSIKLIQPKASKQKKKWNIGFFFLYRTLVAGILLAFRGAGDVRRAFRLLMRSLAAKHIWPRRVVRIRGSVRLFLDKQRGEGLPLLLNVVPVVFLTR